MSRKIVSGIVLALTIIMLLTLTPNIHRVRANGTFETIYIRADGSIDPDGAPISKSGDLYTVTSDIASSSDTYALVIERNYTILDGASHTLSGIVDGSGNAMVWSGIFLGGEEGSARVNVTIKNLSITGFVSGILLEHSNYNTIRGNDITANIASEGGDGIDVYWSSFNYISDNNITDNSDEGIFLMDSSEGNFIYGNTVANNDIGIYIGSDSSNNYVYHNNFIDNTSEQASVSGTSVNLWDNGYPSGGNYWSNYTGSDNKRGPLQDQSGSDGIGDTPYPIERFDGIAQNDTYPLMGLFGGSTQTGTNVTVFPAPDLCFIFEHVTTEGSTTATATTAPPPPPGMTLISACYEISVTAVYAGKITIRMTYDLDGMTQSLHATGTTRHRRSTLVLLQYGVLATDVNKDGKVDLKDVCMVLKALGSRPGNPRWNSACDINNDGVVNCMDLLAVMKDLGKPSPTWTDITKFVDTANHVVYGETDHFSVIGIHSRE